MSFFELSPDVKYDTYNFKIPIDGGGSYTRIARCNPVSNPPALGFNSSSTVVAFLVTCNRDMRNYLRGFNFIVKGHAESSVSSYPFPLNGVDPDTVSIPWDPCALIKNFSIAIDGKRDPLIEQYSNSLYPVAHNQRMLLELSRDVINGSSDMFFTPCLEDTADINTAFSLQTERRSHTWLSKHVIPTLPALPYNQVIFHSKNLPLPLLSSWVAHCDAFTSIRKIEFMFEFKAQDSVLMQMSSNTSQNLYIIDSIELVYNEVSNQFFQDQNQIIERVEGNHPQRFCYPYYDIIEQQYVRNVTVQKNTAKNVQAVIMSFSATNMTGGVSINPYQYVRNGITLLNAKYGHNLVPLRPIELDPLHPMSGTELYTYYKLLLNKSAIENFVPALNFANNFGQIDDLLTGNNGENYCLYCIPFTSTDVFKLQQEGTIYINNTQSPGASTDQIPVYILTITSKFFQLNQDGTLITVN